MKYDTVTDQIVSYIKNNKFFLDSKIVVSEHRAFLNYKALNFIFCGNNVEIRIYNSDFIKIKIEKDFGCVCDNVQSVREQIDKLRFRR